MSDINELNLPKTCEIVFPDQDDLLNFKLIISPDEVCLGLRLCDGKRFMHVIEEVQMMERKVCELVQFVSSSTNEEL